MHVSKRQEEQIKRKRESERGGKAHVRGANRSLTHSESRTLFTTRFLWGCQIHQHPPSTTYAWPGATEQWLRDYHEGASRRASRHEADASSQSDSTTHHTSLPCSIQREGDILKTRAKRFHRRLTRLPGWVSEADSFLEPGNLFTPSRHTSTVEQRHGWCCHCTV